MSNHVIPFIDIEDFLIFLVHVFGGNRGVCVLFYILYFLDS